MPHVSLEHSMVQLQSITDDQMFAMHSLDTTRWQNVGTVILPLPQLWRYGAYLAGVDLGTI
jgi:hypothetical protein